MDPVSRSCGLSPRVHGHICRKAPIVYFIYNLVPAIFQKQHQTFLKLYFYPYNLTFRAMYNFYNYDWVPSLINLIYFNYLLNLLTSNLHSF
jgi:hypothetical protein